MQLSPIVMYEADACSLGSLVVADWMGQPYRVCQISPELMKTEAFTSLNPRGQIPALVLPDRVLTESLAILYHLATNPAAGERAGAFIYAAGTSDFDRLNQVLSYLVSSFHSSWVQVFHPYRYADDVGAQDTIRERALGIARKKYGQIESHFLREDSFFDKLTIADAYFFGLARWGDRFFDVRSAYPKVGRFMDRLSADPSVQFALSVEQTVDRGSQGAFEGRLSFNQLLAELGATARGQTDRSVELAAS
jgi:glutathione S-transferase